VILADPTQMHQVVMNLGTNAAHAMRDRGGVLAISMSPLGVDAPLLANHPDLGPGPFVRLAVSDTGHGMAAGVKDRIFDPYFTTKKVGEGTGMGLAVVQGIVNSHGGAISVYSEPGRGTTFHIFLPLTEAGGAAKSPPAAEEPSGRGTERILFVDDEAILADLGRDLLASFGYAATVTTSSREALDIFRADPGSFDLVITDMTMPGLTGKELAREMLAIRPDIPIVLCSGFSDSINEKQAEETGIRRYVMKPYTTTYLNRIIRAVLSGEQ
jgi:CheY-like chemotaxis protein